MSMKSNPSKDTAVNSGVTGAKTPPPKGITRRRAIKVGVFSLATALPIVMTIAPTEARGSDPS